MFKKIAAYALAAYLTLAPAYVAADPKFSSDFNGSNSGEIFHTRKVVPLKKKDPLKELFNFLEGCQGSSKMNRELSAGIITDTSLPLVGGLEFMVDTKAGANRIIPRTGMKFMYERALFRLYAQGAVDLQDLAGRNVQLNMHFDHRLNKKAGLNLDLVRTTTFGKNYITTNKFTLGFSYLEVEYGISGEFFDGNDWGYATNGFLKYRF